MVGRYLVKEVQGKGIWGDAADGGVRTDPVVILGAPVLDEETGFGQRAEPVLVEAVIAKGAVEAFDEGVLHGFAGLDVMKGHAGALSPKVKGLAGKLGTVIHGDGVGQTAGESEVFQDGDDAGSTDGGIDMEGEALPGEVVDKGEAAEAAATGELVVNEVHGPALIGSGGHGKRDASQAGKFTTQLAAQGEAFLAIEAFGALGVDDEALGFEDIVEDGSTPARLEGCPMAQTFAQSGIVAALGLVLKGGTVPAGDAAGAALREPKTRDDFRHGRASRFGL